MSIQKLHPINSLGILEVSFGEIRIEKLENRLNPKVPFPHKHDFFQLLLITSGAGWHKIDFKKHKVKEGQLFFMKPGQVHSWSFEKKIKGIIIEFSRESMSSEISLTIDLLPDALNFKKGEEFQRVHEIAEIMLSEFSVKNDLYEICIKKLLSSLIVYINRRAKLSSKIETIELKRNINIVEELRKLVEINYKTEHAVEFYANKLGISSKTLTMTISRSIGKSPRSIIQERVLLEAKRYLGYSGLSIAEIGYELGFEDPNYFSRFFRLHLLLTPAQFRQKLQAAN